MAATHIVLVGFPATANENVAFDAFTVEARDGSNVLDATFSGAVILSLSAGSGSLGGSLYYTMRNGTTDPIDDVYADVSGAKTVQFDVEDDLLTGTSGNITIAGAAADNARSRLTMMGIG